MSGGDPTAKFEEADAASPSFRVVGGDPNAEELAAVTAVLTAALEEIASDRERDATLGVSAWQRDQRPIREPIFRGRGAWRAFSG